MADLEGERTEEVERERNGERRGCESRESKGGRGESKGRGERGERETEEEEEEEEIVDLCQFLVRLKILEKHPFRVRQEIGEMVERLIGPSFYWFGALMGVRVDCLPFPHRFFFFFFFFFPFFFFIFPFLF